MKKDEIKNIPTYKKAVVDQILLWIVLFITFVIFLFFTIDYSNALKVNDNASAIGNYTARMIAMNKNESEIVAGLNKIKDDYIATIQEDDLSCTEDDTKTNHQIIVNVYTTLNNSFLPTGNNNVHSKTIVFNESGDSEKECTLTLSFN